MAFVVDVIFVINKKKKKKQISISGWWSIYSDQELMFLTQSRKY
jgi:hypothetical protein